MAMAQGPYLGAILLRERLSSHEGLVNRAPAPERAVCVRLRPACERRCTGLIVRVPDLRSKIIQTVEVNEERRVASVVKLGEAKHFLIYRRSTHAEVGALWLETDFALLEPRQQQRRRRDERQQSGLRVLEGCEGQWRVRHVYDAAEATKRVRPAPAAVNAGRWRGPNRHASLRQLLSQVKLNFVDHGHHIEPRRFVEAGGRWIEILIGETAVGGSIIIIMIIIIIVMTVVIVVMASSSAGIGSEANRTYNGHIRKIDLPERANILNLERRRADHSHR
mmetsp:Transcript_42987/g.94164  ORF Transcript_42987/g.94164 Transcript_42987/m.94164 type:complete len:278 (+) Transcript_42987:46-879(+)